MGSQSFFFAFCFNRFEPSIPEQRAPLSPHIKSVARLFKGDDNALRREHGVGKAEEYFSWFMLTSACLSHGAQGNIPEQIGHVEGTLSYANFELGVLFCSRLQGIEDTDRIYCWKPTRCTCSHSGEAGTRATMIHLPIPYCCHPNRYQIDCDEVDFIETPYFHEVEPGTERIGHMRLTPFGATAAKSKTNE